MCYKSVCKENYLKLKCALLGSLLIGSTWREGGAGAGNLSGNNYCFLQNRLLTPVKQKLPHFAFKQIKEKQMQCCSAAQSITRPLAGQSSNSSSNEGYSGMLADCEAGIPVTQVLARARGSSNPAVISSL